MDADADRIPIYWLWQLNPEDKEFTKTATWRAISQEGDVSGADFSRSFWYMFCFAWGVRHGR